MKLDVARVRALLDELERARTEGKDIDGHVIAELARLMASLAKEEAPSGSGPRRSDSDGT